MRIIHIHCGWLLAALILLASTASAQNSLILKFNDGTQAGLPVTSLDRMTFSNGNVELKKTDASVSTFLMTDISRMTFGLFSGIDEVVYDNAALAVYPSPARNFIMLKNAPDGPLHVMIFRQDGAQVKDFKLTDANQQVDISNFPKGLYLLKVNNKTLKFTKQ